MTQWVMPLDDRPISPSQLGCFVRHVFRYAQMLYLPMAFRANSVKISGMHEIHCLHRIVGSHHGMFAHMACAHSLPCHSQRRTLDGTIRHLCKLMHPKPRLPNIMHARFTPLPLLIDSECLLEHGPSITHVRSHFEHMTRQR